MVYTASNIPLLKTGNFLSLGRHHGVLSTLFEMFEIPSFISTHPNFLHVHKFLMEQNFEYSYKLFAVFIAALVRFLALNDIT